MPSLTQLEIKERAFVFAKEWAGTSREKAESQSFWNEFFEVFGMRRRRVAIFEEPVKKLGDKRGSIDLFWKGTLIVEHKSEGKDLNKAFDQATDYFPGIQEQDLPQYILVSDFSRFRLYDLENRTQEEFGLSDLPDKVNLFGFISGYKTQTYQDEDPVNIQVAEKMGELHDKLLASGYKGHNLEVFLVRLIYLLFADDTGIITPKDHFHYFLENRMNPNGSDTGPILTNIFQILNTPTEDRQTSFDEELLQFPYINGHLFEENLPMPAFSAQMRQILLDCCGFNWGKVSPAIFGSMFQAVMDKETRRNLGAHYTSEKNILKVVHGLFLDDLQKEFELGKHDTYKLRSLHEKIAGLKFFDPACGCGNFLVITYSEIRKLEIQILKQLDLLSGKDARQLVTDVSSLSKIDVDSLYGIELEEFPARIAEVAIWLTDHRMNMELSKEFGQHYARLPLKKAAHIIHGNAVQLDWKDIVPEPTRSDLTEIYILGNPPFVGKKARSAEQVDDMDLVFGKSENTGVLDYVCCWYAKAAKFIRDSKTQVAFVSTNSITQGEQVGVLWQFLQPENITINFAHRTFRWSNEARGNAAVFCVIIGFAKFGKTDKKIFDYIKPDADSMELKVKQINAYLVDADNLIINSRSKPICSVPELSFGSMPNDDGNLLFDEEEKNNFLSKEPKAEKFIRPLISAREFLHGENRYCLWLINAAPEELRALPEVKKRIEAVRLYREISKREATRKLASTPGLFGEIRQPDSNFVLIPLHTSEYRKYIPMVFFTKEFIANNSCATLPNASLYHFGVMQSIMHMVWVKQICGRIKGDYRYSNNVVYNNFIWPENPTEDQRKRVEIAAQEVLDARAMFKSSTLADLYDPDTMPKELVEAHQNLNKAVDICYGVKKKLSELERLVLLFGLYKKYTSPLIPDQVKVKKLRKAKSLIID